MKKAKRESVVGLQEWWSYQARTRAAVRPESDVIDWDEGIEVQEEWLSREMCEQRLREEAERRAAPTVRRVAMPRVTPVVEIEDVALASAALAATALDTA